MDMVSSNYPRGGTQIFNPRVRARPYEDPIDRNLSDLHARLQVHVLERPFSRAALGVAF